MFFFISLTPRKIPTNYVIDFLQGMHNDPQINPNPCFCPGFVFSIEQAVSCIDTEMLLILQDLLNKFMNYFDFIILL